ncbi:uncharacterized protein ACRADG_001485 [Cochliomyia hominivorax]
MEAILPFKIKNEQKFFESALKVGYNEMEIYKFIYILQQSDLDIFAKKPDERINIMLYGWELCEDYKQKLNPDEWELPEEMEIILKHLVPWSLDIWFSKEWDKCKLHLKIALIHCLNRARDLFMRMPDMMQINWDFLLLYNLKPWNVMYLKNLQVTKDKTLENGAQSIETEELPATEEDIAYVKLEQLPLIVLRLIKIFDQSSIDMVKTLCMRVIAAWNKIYQRELETSGSRRPYVPPEDKRCLLLICHIYLMAVYEADDVKGYVIDNMINNIRFYYQGFQNSTALYVMDNLEYTPARFIALTNIHLRVQKRDFFDFFIWNKYDTSLVNLFGVVSQAYKSYLLGNLLMELNNMNEDDFASNIPLYKRLMNSYVNEREKSELFLLNELEKLEFQRYAHNIIQTSKHITDFKSKICKGNRMSNIGNYENSDDTAPPPEDLNNEKKIEIVKQEELKEEIVVVGDDEEDELERVRVRESELRLDPIFQNLPNNQSILYYVYDVLAKKNYKGWHFAKVVLLVKIIDHELNMIETWRYHPGLTTDFMLNLEVKLSHHYVDLAKIFKDHAFLEQEFWLTAFYLNPTSDIYEVIKRLGMRNNRKRADEQTKLVMSVDNVDAKFGLLSSTIDVKEIATLANTEDPDTDYNPLFSALHSLRVPDSLVKDMITAIFLPRNKSFAWVVDWTILRMRCKMIMNSPKEKKRFVELNMAEANDRLKYLIIDYEKYKNRPQLDYGTIEEGYENLMASGDFDKESEEEEEEEEEEEDFEDDEDIYESKKRGRGSSAAAARKKEEEKVQDENSQEDDPFLMGKRRTRARTAATLASFLFQTLPRTSRRKKNQKPSEEETNAEGDKSSPDNDDKSSESKSPITTTESPAPSPDTIDKPSDSNVTEEVKIPTRNIKECLKERPQFLNSTQGFQNLIDIWNVEKSDLQIIDENCVSLMESSAVLQRAVKWKQLNKEINPLGCDEQEYIDDTELVIHNAEFAIKMEYNLSAVKEEPKTGDVVVKVEEESWNRVNQKENKEPMEVDASEEKVITDNVVDSEESKTVKNIMENDSVTGKETKSVEFAKNQKISPVEDNSNESISNESTEAHKDSGEVSETNTEINSKRNSINNDNEVEDKITQNDDSNEITTKQKESEEADKDANLAEQQKTTETYQTPKDNEEKQDISDERVREEKSEKGKDTENKLQKNDDQENLNTRVKAAANQEKEIETEIKAADIPEKQEEELNKESKDDVKEKVSDKLKTIGKEDNKEELKEEIKETKGMAQGKDKQEDKDKDTVPENMETQDKPQEEESKIKESLENEEEFKLIYDEEKNDSLKKDNKAEQEAENDNTTLHNKEDQVNVSNQDESLNTSQLQNESLIELHYSSNEELENERNSSKTKLSSETKADKKRARSPADTDSNKTRESTDSETRKLKNLCLTKNLKILIKKLQPVDLINLRQPKVKIQRIKYEKYLEEFKTKRRRVTGKAYVDLDESSNSTNSYVTNSSSSEAYRPVRVKRKVPIRRHSMRQLRASESDNESNNSDDFKLSAIRSKVRERRISTPSTSQSSTQNTAGTKSTRQTTGPKSKCQNTGPKSSKQNLVVTPRSASGLKLRISNAEQGPEKKRKKSSAPVIYEEIIQLSSSSSDACIVNDLSAIAEEVIEVEDNPLYEEEIIIKF